MVLFSVKIIFIQNIVINQLESKSRELDFVVYSAVALLTPDPDAQSLLLLFAPNTDNYNYI